MAAGAVSAGAVSVPSIGRLRRSIRVIYGNNRPMTAADYKSIQAGLTAV